METQFYWYDETAKNIMVINPKNEIDWESFHRTKGAIDTMITSVNHSVYFIIEFINESKLPIGRSSIKEFSTAFGSAPPNVVGIYVVGAPALIRIVFNSMKFFNRTSATQNVIMIKTLEDAVSMIQSKQKTVNTDPRKLFRNFLKVPIPFYSA